MLLAGLAAGCVAAPQPSAPAEAEPELLGPLTREEIEAAVPSWVAAQIEAAPDPAQATRLAEAASGAEVTVLLGTWCEDSRRELSRLWRAIDFAGGAVPFGLVYVGVDRAKLQPAELVAGSDLLYVPTLIVRRQGEELGRIVEESPRGIEFDLAALLAGEISGLITARSDLAP